MKIPSGVKEKGWRKRRRLYFIFFNNSSTKRNEVKRHKKGGWSINKRCSLQIKKVLCLICYVIFFILYCLSSNSYSSSLIEPHITRPAPKMGGGTKKRKG
jgi:hypothetical protein